MAQKPWQHFINSELFDATVETVAELLLLGDLAECSRIVNRAVAHVYPVRNRPIVKREIVQAAVVAAESEISA